MSDYVIHAKLKNGNLLRAILDVSPNVNAFCVEHGLSPTTIGNLINLRSPALLASGQWCAAALHLSEILGPLPDELFVAEQQTSRLATNSAVLEISRDQALAIASGLDRVEQIIDAKRVVSKLLCGSSSREKNLLDMRYKQDMTLDETAKALGVTRERARQIEMKALSRIRTKFGKSDVFGEARELVR